MGSLTHHALRHLLLPLFVKTSQHRVHDLFPLLPLQFARVGAPLFPFFRLLTTAPYVLLSTLLPLPKRIFLRPCRGLLATPSVGKPLAMAPVNLENCVQNFGLSRQRIQLKKGHLCRTVLYLSLYFCPFLPLLLLKRQHEAPLSFPTLLVLLFRFFQTPGMRLPTQLTDKA